MPTTFPGVVDVYLNKVDYVDYVLGAHINDPQDAIVAIEAKVGITHDPNVQSLDYFRARPMDIRDTSDSVFTTGSVTGGLAEAVADLAGAPGMVFAGPHNHPINANYAIPATVHLMVSRGATFTVANGITLTINGTIEAGLYQIFSLVGTGVVAFGLGILKEYHSEWFADGQLNIGLGRNALRLNTIGTWNAALGYNALAANTTGAANTAIGYETLRLNTTGYSNTAVGLNALQANVDGFSNVAMGQDALYVNTSGRDNTALGTNALMTATTGDMNTAVGAEALHFHTTASNNTAVGGNALYAITTGANNVAVGFMAGEHDPAPMQTTASSVFIGQGARNDADGYTNSVVLGATAVGTKSNQVVLGNTSITETLLRAMVEIPSSDGGTGVANGVVINFQNLNGTNNNLSQMRWMDATGVVTNHFGVKFTNHAGHSGWFVWSNLTTELLRLDNSGHLTPGGNKTQNLGGAGNRWSTIFSANVLNVGTSRLIGSAKLCPVCDTQMVRGTGGVCIVGVDRDYYLAFCPACGAAAVEELKHSLPEDLPRRRPAPKIIFVGFKVVPMGGNSRTVRVDFKYGDGEDAPTNSTFFGESELDEFLKMDYENRGQFVAELGQREWESLEETRLLKDHCSDLQRTLDDQAVSLAGMDMSKYL